LEIGGGGGLLVAFRSEPAPGTVTSVENLYARTADGEQDAVGMAARSVEQLPYVLVEGVVLRGRRASLGVLLQGMDGIR
jgi:hypothetical protein